MCDMEHAWPQPSTHADLDVLKPDQVDANGQSALAVDAVPASASSDGYGESDPHDIDGSESPTTTQSVSSPLAPSEDDLDNERGDETNDEDDEDDEDEDEEDEDTMTEAQVRRKHVSFHALPSVRFYKKSQSATFTDNDVEDHRWQHLRCHRSKVALREGVVTEELLPINEFAHLLGPVPDTLREQIEAAVRTERSMRKSRDPDGPPAWKQRRVTRGVDCLDRHLPDEHQVVVTMPLMCSMKEVKRAMETGPTDEWDAALYACLSRQFAVDDTLLERTEAMVDQKSQAPEKILPSRDLVLLSVKKLHLQSKHGSRSKSRSLKRLTSSPPLSSSSSSGVGDPQGIVFIDQLVLSEDGSAVNARILQTVVPSEHTGHRVELGDSSAGCLFLKDVDDFAWARVFVSRKIKPSKHSHSRRRERVDEALVGGMASVAAKIHNLVMRRRLGMQSLTFPHTVYGNDAKEAEDEADVCATCLQHFGLFRRQHFCHLCALWVCHKCSNEQEIGFPQGWTQRLRFCVSCLGRLSECRFEDPVLAESSANNQDAADELGEMAALSLVPHNLAETLLRVEAADDEESVTTDIVRAFVEVFSPDDEVHKMLEQPEQVEDDVSQVIDTAALISSRLASLSIPLVPPHLCLYSPEHDKRQYELVFHPETGIPRAPVALDDPVRVQRVNNLGVYDIQACAQLDRLCRLVATELSCSHAFISVMDDYHISYIATNGAKLARLNRNDGFCAYTMQSTDPFLVRNAAQDLRFYRLSLVQKEGIRFYCGVPLVGPDKTFFVATLAIADQTPRSSLSAREYSLLRGLAKVVRRVLLQQAHPVVPVP